MESVILIIHLIIVVSLVFVILLQRSSQDGLSGLGGGSSNPGGMVQVRGSGNLLTKMTSFLAVGFITTSLTLAYLANQSAESVLDKVEQSPAAITVPDASTSPEEVEPVVPLAE